MSFAPYLLFPGTAREAFEGYARVFGAGGAWAMTVADAEASGAAGAEGLPRDPGHVIHAQILAGPGAPLMGADGGEAGVSPGAALYAAPDAGTAARVFSRLAEGGEVRRPLGPAFWSPLFGIVADRWRVVWRITLAPGEDR